MTSDRRATVLVVGLGAAGSATLHQLARIHAGRQAHLIGIDMFDPPHEHGSSHGETRVTRRALGEGLEYVPLAMRSHEIWDALEKASGHKLIDRCGMLLMGSPGNASTQHGKEHFLARTIEAAERFDIPHRGYNTQEIRRRYPQFNIEDGTEGYFEPGAGMLYPERCLQAQLDEARRLGAKVATGIRAHAVRQKGDVVKVKTSAGDYTADHVVLACGPWLPPMLDREVGARLTVSRQVLHWFEVDDERAFAAPDFPVYVWLWGSGPSDFFYGFPSLPGSRRIKVASEGPGDGKPPSEVDRSVGKQEQDAFFAYHLKDRMRGVRPECVASKTCLYTDADDHAFFVDQLQGQDRVTYISACSGHGFKHAAAIGEAVAQSITTGVPSRVLQPFRASRPRPPG